MSASDYECSRFYLDENRLSGDLTSRWSATECAGGQVYEMPIWTSGLSNCTSPRMNLCRALIQTRGLEALSRHCELAYCLLALRVFAAQCDRLIAGKKHPRAIGQHNEAIRPAVQGSTPGGKNFGACCGKTPPFALANCIVSIASVTTRSRTLTQLRFAIQRSPLVAPCHVSFRPRETLSSKAATGKPTTPSSPAIPCPVS
jgi:hypothetical protein